MNNYMMQDVANKLWMYHQSWAWFLPALTLISIWTLFWKGKALWHAAKHNELKWFVALLILNTVGIMEILFLYVFSKNKKEFKL